MILLTLEGLPHSGKCAVLRCLMQRCPGWKAVNVAPSPLPSCSWTSPSCRTSHALFSALLRKVRALSAAPCEPRVVMFNCPWFEHLPRNSTLDTLLTSATQHLIRSVECDVSLHIMVLLHVHHDETFEQMVNCGNPFWNGTSIADVHAAQDRIAGTLARLAAGTEDHPFPCATHTVKCPPFFEENEVVVHHIAQTIVDIVAGTV